MDFFPTEILVMIEVFAPYFGANNFNFFRGFMLAYMLLGQSRKCVTNIAKVCFFVDRHISSWERFLATSQWKLADIQKSILSLITSQLKEKMLIHGAYLGFLDTTLISKIKGKMAGVQKWHDHSGNPNRGEHLIGHHWALLGLIGVGTVGSILTTLCFPLLANLISGKLNSLGFVINGAGEAQPMKFWDTVCPLIAQLQTMLGHQPLRIVADAYFSKAPFINWMLRLGVDVITRMRADAVGWDDPEPEPEANGQKKRGRKPIKEKKPKGKKWKLAKLLTNFPTESITVIIYGAIRKMDVVCRDMWITDVEKQKVRVVVIRTKGKPFILLSTDLTISAKQIIEIYGLRFSGELSIRDLKQNFGMNDYQCTSLLAIIRYVGLALIGYSFWKLALLKDEKADWLQHNDKVSSLSFTRISRSLRGFVMNSIFKKSAQNAELQNSLSLPKELIQMIV